ncbi:MAG TPA: carbohydrate binding family 9 domain-containing protein [Pyrinomonadaceae bacterium]|nr:carbohydrate binding family 9 domain-containing protein [Pyrinomonadaceae bacterium]
MKRIVLLSALIVLFAVNALAQSNGSTPTPAPPSSPAPSPALVSASPSLNPPGTETSSTTDTKAAATVAAPAAKGAVTLPPEKANPVTIPKFEKPPTIDGVLNDPVWQSAAVLKDFYQIDPGDNIAPSKPTEVLIGYDSRFLYIAFKAFDEQDKIRSTVAKRDNIWQDDYVGFYLDTFNDKRRAFELFFNPLGIQGDGILTEGRGEDMSIDLLLDSKGTITSEGYFVEIAIPFKSLRYEAGKGKLWGAHFFRRIQRFNRELDSWMPFSRSIDGNMNQAGHLGGLEGISVERTIELIPSLTLSQDGRFVRTFGVFPNTPAAATDPGRIVNQPLAFDPGLTAKFIPSPAITVDLAINPDFAQVEADQLVVTANQRFPIFFPEKRPFFLEGIDVFTTPVTAVHTRSIVDPDVAIKTTGKIGRTSFGLIAASDNGPGNLSLDDRGALNVCRDRRALDPRVVCNNERFEDKNAHIGVLRLKRDIGKENSLGILATSYNFIEKHNQLVAIDGRFRLDKQTTLTFQTLGTTSRNFFFDPNEGKTRYRTGNGFGYSYDYNVSGRNWGYELFGEGFTKDYRADVGFFQRQNSNFNFAFVRYNSDPKPKQKIISYHIHNASHIDYDWQGRMYTWESENLVELSLPRSSWLGVWYEPAYERLFDHEFGPTREAKQCNPFGLPNPCTFFGESNERSVMKQHISGYFGSNFNKKIQFNGQVTYRVNHLDLDFGNLPKYPRASPPAVRARELAAAGRCTDTDPNDGIDARDPGCVAPQDPGAGKLLQMNGSITFQPTNEFRTSISLNKQRLVRNDTGLTAFDVNIWTWRGTYQFTKSYFARAIVDYNTLNSRVRAQFLTGWTPSPGTSFYIGYNDDVNYASAHPFTSQIVPGFRRNSRTFFVKMSYLIRRSFGGN